MPSLEVTKWPIREEPISELHSYALLPIAFRVETRLEVELIDAGLGGLVLHERAVAPPYIKDYDAVSGERPGDWAARWDLLNWGLMFAVINGERVGGVAVAFNTPNLDMLDGRKDLAIVWDIRVRPDYRGHGAGTALFAAAEEWARARGCHHLKVETQNINVPACRLYASQGCTLGSINMFAYPDLPEETQLIWYKELK